MDAIFERPFYGNLHVIIQMVGMINVSGFGEPISALIAKACSSFKITNINNPELIRFNEAEKEIIVKINE